jgi:hypothetical protein
MTSELELCFHNDMLGIYHEASKLGYRPSYFLKMVSQKGGVATAHHLLDKSGTSDGFTRLWELNRLDLSVEALVLESRYHSLFSTVQLATATDRLKEYEFIKD